MIGIFIFICNFICFTHTHTHVTHTHFQGHALSLAPEGHLLLSWVLCRDRHHHVRVLPQLCLIIPFSNGL